jgi:ubiquinone biosynthesis accessory factor UbiK
MDTRLLDELARLFSEAIPPGARDLQRDFEKNARALLTSAFSRLDLVSREEFDVQMAVLARTRAKVEALERQVAALEQQMLHKNNEQPSTDSGADASGGHQS